jgi:protein-tyrosine phosphatase
MRAPLHVIAGLGSGQLATIAHPRSDGWETDELSTLADSGVTVLVSALTTVEQQRMGLAGTAATAAALGLDFISFPAADGALREEAARVVGLAGRLATHVRAGRFVATQCFGGVGRSTLLACTTLVLLGIAPGDALRRVTGGSDMPVTRDWLYELSAHRAAHL